LAITRFPIKDAYLSVDVHIQYYFGVKETAWFDARNSSVANLGALSYMVPWSGSYAGSEIYHGTTCHAMVGRTFMCVDVTLGSRATITSAKLYVDAGMSGTITLVEGTQHSTDHLEYEDFNNFGSTKWCVSDLTYLESSGFDYFLLNETALAALSTNGYTKFCILDEEYDFHNVDPSAGKSNAFYGSGVDITGSVNTYYPNTFPYLEVEFTPAVYPSICFR
jgi:hypothetical protein